MANITRLQAENIQKYVHQVCDEKVYSILPDDDTLRAMSRIFDASAQKAYVKFENILEDTHEFQAALKRLEDPQKTPRCCGGFSLEKAILTTKTPFEQTALLCRWVEEKGQTMEKPHTIALYSSDDSIVPVWLKKPARGHVSKMTIFLGNSSGNLKAPIYKKWSKTDPRKTVQEVFIDPLNCLEMHRQPDCIAALILKENPYERELLGSDWRYKVYEDEENDGFAKEASVELPKQKSAKARKIKQQSAGYNLATMVAQKTIRNKNLLPDLNFEDYSEEGYDDAAIPGFSPKDIVRTFSAVLQGDTDELDKKMAILFATQLRISEIPSVKKATAEQLFGK